MSRSRASIADVSQSPVDEDLKRLFDLILEAKRLARALDQITVSYLLDFALVDLSERVEVPKKERASSPRRRLPRRLPRRRAG